MTNDSLRMDPKQQTIALIITSMTARIEDRVRGAGTGFSSGTLRNQPYAPQQLVESRIAPQCVQSRVGL